VGEESANALDVLRPAAVPVGLVDGDEYACAAPVDVGELVPTRPERAVQDAREPLVAALDVVVERQECVDARVRVKRGEERLGVGPVERQRRIKAAGRAG